MAHRLRHIASGAVISTGSERRRDWFLRRGFALVGEPEATWSNETPTVETPNGWGSQLSDLSWQELRKQATALGINAKQKRPALERAIVAAKR